MDHGTKEWRWRPSKRDDPWNMDWQCTRNNSKIHQKWCFCGTLTPYYWLLHTRLVLKKATGLRTSPLQVLACSEFASSWEALVRIVTKAGQLPEAHEQIVFFLFRKEHKWQNHGGGGSWKMIQKVGLIYLDDVIDAFESIFFGGKRAS